VRKSEAGSRCRPDHLTAESGAAPRDFSRRRSLHTLPHFESRRTCRMAK
jgi:hypothetical protein